MTFVNDKVECTEQLKYMLMMNNLPPLGRILLEEVMVAQPVKNSPPFN